MVLGDSSGRGGLDSPVGLEDEEERQAVALSLEGVEENENEEEDIDKETVGRKVEKTFLETFKH